MLILAFIACTVNKLGVPSRPTSFALFTSHFLKSNSGKRLTDAAAAWKELSEVEKNKYTKYAQEYAQKVKDYISHAPPEMKEHWVKLGLQKMVRRASDEKVRAENGYILFAKEYAREESQNREKTADRQRQLMSEAGQKWRQMSDAEKQVSVANAAMEVQMSPEF